MIEDVNIKHVIFIHLQAEYKLASKSLVLQLKQKHWPYVMQFKDQKLELNKQKVKALWHLIITHQVKMLAYD